MPADLSFLPDFQRARLADFRQDVRAGRAAVLIGAGVSRRAGMVDGWTLASRLAEGRDVPAAIADDLIAVCDHLDSVYGAPWLRRELARMLDDERIPLSDAHQLLARIPFSSYYTTNVDRLMEWALADSGRPHSTLFLDPDAALLPIGKCPVVKLHGTIDHPHTMVFTSGDFDLFSGLMERLLFQAATATNLLIVGYRGTDPNFLRMLTLVRQRFGGSSPILIDFGRETERQALLDQGMFLVDPGPGQYDRLIDILAWAGDLDDDVVEVCRQRHGRVARANPFPGLAPYGIGAGNFHGRDDVVCTLADRLDSLGPVTVFFGDSGCGKTSLFQAGLLPELERRGIPWAQVGSNPGGDPSARLAEAVRARLGAKPGQSLRVCLSSLQRQGRRMVVVIDQFERVLVPEPSAAAERFLATTLPELAGDFGNVLRVLIVLRSDALYQLHSYRNRPGLEGVYMAAERLETLDRTAALALVSEVFLAKGYRLAPKAAAALVARTTSAQGAVYLPYLQLLCRTLFDRLDEAHGAQRGLGAVVPVAMRAITALVSAEIILRHVRDAALALARIEPDRATVLKLFDLLTERHRRAILRRDRLAEEFVEPARVIALLHDLANRRVVHFDEVLEGYELVHDSLVEPVRDFLDQERTDFSHGDLLALARRLFEGNALPPAALGNLARHCLRRGLSPAWLERVTQPVAGWLAFWTEARLSCREDERLLVWERMARWAERESRPPAIAPVEALALLLTTRDPRLALAVLRVLAALKLTDEDVETVWRWLDPDRAEMANETDDEDLLERLNLPRDRIAALGTSPLRRGWGEVVDAALDILFAERHVDPAALFAGYHAEIYSEAVWWEPYLRRLAALPPRHRAAGKVIRRMEDSATRAANDPELLIALTRALLAAPDPVERWSGILQRLADSLAKRSRRLGFDLFLPVAELLLEAVPKFVFIKTKTLFPDLVHAGLGRRAAHLLGLAAQEPEDLDELLFRTGTFVSDPEVQCWLTHAALESPAEVGVGESVGGHLLDVVEDCHRPTWGSACAAILTGESWAAEGLALFEQWSDRDLPVRVYALTLLDWGLSGQEFWLLRSRAWRLLCAVALRQVEDDIDCIRHDPLTAGWGDVADSWDQVAEEVGTGGPPLLQVAEELDGQLRWLRHVTADVDLEEIGAPRLLMTQWFTDYEALPHRLQGIWPSTCRLLATRSHAFQNLMDSAETNDPKASLPAMVERLGLSGQVKVKDIVDAMRTYREAEDRTQSRVVLSVAEELVVMMVSQLAQEPQPGAEGFLWAILDRSSWIGLPGLAEHEVESLTIAALLRAYQGVEPYLLESLAHNIKEPAWLLRALLPIAESHPTLASAQLADAIASVVADRDDSPEACRAIRLLEQGNSAPPILDLLRQLVPHRNELVAAAACRSLFALSTAAKDRLLILEQALHRPVLSESLEFPIRQL